VNQRIEDKAPKPPGLLPKHVQSWLIAGLAVLMVLIMWVTGLKKPQTAERAGTRSAIPPPLVEVNEAKIAELQNRIEELQREQLVAQNALTQQSRFLATGPVETSPAELSGRAPGERAEDPIETERKKRNYLSLFASNVALSYRKNAATAPTPESTSVNLEPGIPGSLSGPEASLLSSSTQPPVSPAMSAQKRISLGSYPGAAVNSLESGAQKKEVIQPAAAAVTRNLATGKSYVLFEGTILEAVLINRLDGSFTGPIECLLSTDSYSHDRQHLLIPAGSKLLGETRKVEAFGTTRLAVLFHRLIMPDGYSVSLDQFKGLNQGGDTGLRDQVNNHYPKIFGASLAVGALGAAAQFGTGSVFTQSGADRLREGFGISASQSSVQILDKFLSILPTITIREGHRVRVYLAGDLSLPAYNNHTMPSDL
jgi:type IV secretory pathway VirB10-like protein